MPKATAPNPADWRRVWHHVEARRQAEGLTWTQVYRASGISERTFTQMRKHGQPLTLASKRAALAAYMRWTIRSLDIVAAGGDPEPGTTVMPLDPDVSSRLDALEDWQSEMAVELRQLAALLDAIAQQAHSHGQDGASIASGQ